MLHAALALLPFAAVLAVLPGPATAMVIRSAARGGRAHAIRAMLGDAAGLAVWATASMLGVSATGALMIGFGLRLLADR